MAQAKYSKLGYGNAEDVEAAIALGMLDGRDMIITKDSSEFMYVMTCLFRRFVPATAVSPALLKQTSN